LSNSTAAFSKKYQGRIALFAILILAFALRVWGLNFGLPNLSRPDEQNIANAVMLHIFPSFMAGHPSLNPQFFNYPSLFIYLCALGFGLFYALGRMSGLFLTAESFRQLYFNDWSHFLLIERLLSVAFGTFGVWAMVQLGAAFRQSKRFGLACGLLLAVTYLHVRDSHFGVTDIAATTFATLCLWQSLIALQKGAQKALSRAAVFAGLAASTKYPLALVGVAPACVFVLLAQAKGARGSDFFQKTPLITHALQLLGLFLGAFLVCSPYVLLDFSHFWQDFSWQQNSFQSVFERENIAIGWIRHLTFSLWHGLGPLYLATSLAGIFLAIRSRNPIHWPLLLFAGVFYLAIGGSKTVFVRYILPIVPVFCLYAVFALSRLNDWLEGRVRKDGWHFAAMLLAALGVAGGSLSHSLHFNWLSSQADTRSLARDWLIARLRPGDGVGIGKALSHVDLPLYYDKYFLTPVEDANSSPHEPGHFILPSRATVDRRPTERHEFSLSTYHDVETLRRLNIRYVVVAQSPLKIYAAPDVEIEALRRNPQLQLAQSFLNAPPGGKEPPESAYDWEDAFYVPYSHFGELQRPGPNIFIFRVLPAALVPDRKSQ
jgi:4-amino-4-deoxy-L-arabinose transferase-like glycosyltransferase